MSQNYAQLNSQNSQNAASFVGMQAAAQMGIANPTMTDVLGETKRCQEKLSFYEGRLSAVLRQIAGKDLGYGAPESTQKEAVAGQINEALASFRMTEATMVRLDILIGNLEVVVGIAKS